MMKMIVQNSNHPNQNSADVIKQYIWDKSWVRPYESALSVYMNFVGINAFTYVNVLHCWDCRDGNFERYVPELNSSILSHSKFPKILMEKLLPDDFYRFPELKGSLGYRKNFHYCPECIKQGYHSMLSQIPHETTCPIHNIPYIDHGKPIHIAERGRRFDVYMNEFGRFPLPPEREGMNYSLIEKHINNEFPDTIYIGYAAPYIGEEDKQDYCDKMYSVTNREEVAVIDDSFSYRQFEDSLWNYFTENAKKVFTTKTVCVGRNIDIPEFKDMGEYMEWFRDSIYKDYAPASNYLANVMLFACMCDYIKDVDRLEWPGEFPRQQVVKDNSYMCNASNPAYVKASYIYAVRGNTALKSVFDFMYVIIKHRDIAPDVHNEYHTILLNMATFVERAVSGFKNVAQIGTQKTPPVVAALCVQDQFWYQAKKYEEDIQERGVFLYHNEWRNIPPIMYQIQQRSNGNIVIYRMMQ